MQNFGVVRTNNKSAYLKISTIIPTVKTYYIGNEHNIIKPTFNCDIL